MCKEGAFSALDLSQPLNTSGMLAVGIRFDLQLSANGVVVTREKPPKRIHKKFEPQPPEVITVPKADIKGISVGYNQESHEIPITLQFARKTRLGKHISFRAEPSALLMLVRWQQQMEKPEVNSESASAR
jgi:hypothetical protein